jgi:hypothetical protein
MSSSLGAPSAVAILSTALLCGLSGTAMSRSEPPSASAALPSITIPAPKPVARPQKPTQRSVARSSVRHTGRNTVPPRTSPTVVTASGKGSVLARLRQLERESGSCVGGCESSLPSGNRPWVGCSASAWPMPSSTCRNPRKYKTYVACTETSYFLGWKPMEVWWYCSNLALNK